MRQIEVLMLAALLCAGCDGTAPGTPTTLATAPGSPGGLVVDTSYVYWTSAGAPKDGGTVVRAPIDGGAAEVIAKDQPGPFALALHGGNLFWANRGTGFGDGELRKLLTPSGAPELLVGQLVGPYDIAVNESDVIAFTEPDDQDMSARVKTLSGGVIDASIAGMDLSRPENIAIAGNEIYWTDADAGTVMKGDTEMDTMASVVASGQARPRGIAVGEGGYIYWANTGNDTGADGAVMRILVVPGSSEGASVVVDNQNIGGRGRIALGNGHVYWVNVEGDDHTVMSAPVDGGTPTELAVGQGSAVIDIAVDANNVYWTVAGEGDGSVLTIETQ